MSLVLSLLLLAAPVRADDGVHAPPPSLEEEAPPTPAAVPEGWTMVAPPVAPVAPPERPLAIPAGSPPPPPPPPAAAAPAGWREVQPPAGTTRARTRPADERVFALGGTVGGGSSLAVDGLLRAGRSVVFDLGVGPQLHPRTLEPVSARLTVGATWQPGTRTTRHGVVVRGGLGFEPDRDEASESLLLAGYAWRLVPHDSPLTLELEAAPGVLYREHGPHGEEWVALATFVRFGAHLWLW